MDHTVGFHKLICLIFVFLILLPVISAAQKQSKDNFGKEFYIAFGENHGGGDDTKNSFTLSITSRQFTKGMIEVKGLGWNMSFTVDAGMILSVELPDGKNFGDPTVECITDEQVLKGMAVHITSDNDIAVYGMNYKELSGDAFMALPVEVLGTEYRTMNYQSSITGQGANTPGEFWIVGTADATAVTITPKAKTSSGALAGVPIPMILDKGDVFLVQGDATEALNDLTGSLITSDHPVAVFSGHVRTEIPAGFKNFNSGGSTSRNHLVEQLPPVSAWSNSAVVARYQSAILPDLVRIVSAEDGNAISVNGKVLKTLNAGDFYEIPQLTGPLVIQATAPILVGQYMHTSKFGTFGTDPAYGDPAYSIIYSPEQFNPSACTFFCYQSQIFPKSFINVITDATGITSMILDNKSISDTAFQPIPFSNYMYAQIPVAEGAHRIQGLKPFGITVYGFGELEAYSYPGGAGFTSNRNAVPISNTSISGFTSNPNPFTQQAIIEFTLNTLTNITLEIYDELGRLVWQNPGSSLEAGSHTIRLDGSSLPSGTLYARIATGFGEVKTVKLVHEK